MNEIPKVVFSDSLASAGWGELLPEPGGGHSYTSTENHKGFPGAYDERALLEWGHAQWLHNRSGAD
jgi:hypothetical protein